MLIRPSKQDRGQWFNNLIQLDQIATCQNDAQGFLSVKEEDIHFAPGFKRRNAEILVSSPVAHVNSCTLSNLTLNYIYSHLNTQPNAPGGR